MFNITFFNISVNVQRNSEEILVDKRMRVYNANIYKQVKFAVDQDNDLKYSIWSQYMCMQYGDKGTVSPQEVCTVPLKREI